MVQNTKIYNTSLALLTDLYQLTMSYGYWKLGKENEEAVFHLYFRKNPFDGGYAVAAGLSSVIDIVNNFEFTEEDLKYLASLKGNDGKPMFKKEFLVYLQNMKLNCKIYAVPEGTVVFPNEPIIRIQGPIIQAQILETVLLNVINFQTLIATKASRMRYAAGGDPILEFGLRRAQGIDGGLSASRAAYIGGATATSNVLAGKLYNIPVKGTHAHSWVMSFKDESASFIGYAKAMPNNCVFLVDTYDTINGVKKAVEVGKALRENGHEMIGIRLDSGDLAHLSIEARKILDENGFSNAKIIASNDLDEHIIQTLKLHGAEVDTWGIGTKLATSYDQAALGGVYKLGAIKKPNEDWVYRVKISEQIAKTTIPGILQVRRFRDNYGNVIDMIYDELLGVAERKIVDPKYCTQISFIEKYTHNYDLLVPIFEDGKQVYEQEDISVIKERVCDELNNVSPSTKRLIDPREYAVGIESTLSRIRTQMIRDIRKNTKNSKENSTQ